MDYRLRMALRSQSYEETKDLSLEEYNKRANELILERILSSPPGSLDDLYEDEDD